MTVIFECSLLNGDRLITKNEEREFPDGTPDWQVQAEFDDWLDNETNPGWWVKTEEKKCTTD